MSCDFLTTKGVLRKLCGDKVSGKVYTFNGDTSGKFAANNIVNISEDVPDLKNLTKIVLTNSDGETGEYPLSDLTYMEHEDMEGFVDPNDINRMYVVSLYSGVGGGPAGLYVRCADSDYVSRIEFADTIVPIAPKYLPKGGFGYSEPSTIVVIPKGSYEINNGLYEVQTTQFPNEGDLITLTLDGAVYSKAAKSTVIDEGKVVYIGNDSGVGLEDTGENYFAGFLLDSEAAFLGIMSEAGNDQTATHTVELSFVGQTIVPIASQYMPCVTLETIVSAIETIMSEADAAKLDALAAVGMPAVIKFKYEVPSSGDAAIWCSYIKFAGTTVFKCYLGAYETNLSFTFVGAGGEWKCLYAVE